MSKSAWSRSALSNWEANREQPPDDYYDSEDPEEEETYTREQFIKKFNMTPEERRKQYE